MSKVTRHESRECLLQALYAKSVHGASFSLDGFLETYYDDRYNGLSKDPYFAAVFAGVPTKEAELVAIVKKFAPKFDISIMPVVNILPIFIAAYEMLFLEGEAVPEKVSIDEAVELAKKFSDDPSRMLVNGVLNSLRNERETIFAELPKLTTGYVTSIFSL